MRRRWPLVLCTVLAAATIALVVRSPGTPAADARHGHAHGGRDSLERDSLGRDSVLAANDSAAVAAPADEEPPCIASRLGLPCR